VLFNIITEHRGLKKSVRKEAIISGTSYGPLPSVMRAVFSLIAQTVLVEVVESIQAAKGYQKQARCGRTRQVVKAACV
jgi:hypothetical protein